ncbi:MAG: redox-sensing transcriptional repressor Rex [Kiritimatiellae bacterium]|nr:redox-sensing transcriptional repressor Rex [Kiritimatiellia bacterium]MDD4735923.1 redox-sensing transcriptional repressor Rex [Kiritimatiellia bacterium]
MKTEIVKRLSQYKSVLIKLKTLGFVKVFSDNLGDAIGISSSQVRRDFSAFGLTGNKRGGYRIDELIEQLAHILGKDEVQKIVIVGCGKIGRALMNHTGFTREGIQVMAGFDINMERVTQEGQVPIYHISDMGDYVQREGISVAIMTVPENVASQVMETLVNVGIRGILNFAPVTLKSVSDRCEVHNINIALEIEKLFSLMYFAEKQK